MVDGKTGSRPLGILRALALSLLVAVAACALAAWPANAWAGREGLQALAWAGAIGWLAAVAGHLTAHLLTGLLPGPGAAIQALQAGMGVRLLITLIGATPIFLLKLVPTLPFTAWIALHYLAQLVLEVFVSLRIVGQNPGPSAGNGGRADEGLAAQGPATRPAAQARPTGRD